MRAERKGNRRRDNYVLMTSFQISLALGPSDGSALHNARFVPYSMTSSFFNTFSFEIGKRRAREAGERGTNGSGWLQTRHILSHRVVLKKSGTVDQGPLGSNYIE